MIRQFHVLYLFVLLAFLLSVDAHRCVGAVTLEELSNTVVYFREGNYIGTGFLVRDDYPFLVTAEHVANVLTHSSSITVRAPGDRPISLTVAQLVPAAKTLPWIKHPENDVAVLRLQSTAQLAPEESRFFPIKQVPTTEAAPMRERVVTVMGFPQALGTTGRFSPITSNAQAASGLLRLPRADTKKEATFFVLDKPSIGGFSGGPVFLLPAAFSYRGMLTMPGKDSAPICVGLVHGTIGDRGGTLAVVIPSSFIVETIKAAR